MALDLDRIRRETPVCEKRIYLNNAGCSLQPAPVYRAVLEYLDQEQETGGYEAAAARQPELEGFYDSVARLINCRPDEIAYCESATRGWQQFFYSLRLNPGDRIITTRVDYGSNMVAYIQASRYRDVEIVFLDTDEKGDIDLDHLHRLVTDRTRLISVSHIPTGNGMINPAEKIGEIAGSAGVPFLLDACQSSGHLDLDVKRLQCTALSTAGRKYLRGPRGSGFLFVSREYLENAHPAFLEQQGADLIDETSYQLVESARRFENFECNLAGKLGLGVAVNYAMQWGLAGIEDRVIRLGARCRECLEEIPGVQVHDQGSRQCGIVTFTVEGVEASVLRSRLAGKGIHIWVSAGPGSLVDFQQRGLDAVARASVHYFNTREEIEIFGTAIASIAARARQCGQSR
ncbi:MAG: aminotransferase class V-fold PLP-dependent enzyme [Gammaproteobacteria bacterium]|nr:aminotransferase class V-fold PLP-dependent enzyme [Gammaproteobacteria bacterium]